MLIYFRMLDLERRRNPPLLADDRGTIRVGQTRVTLDSVVEAFREGATAEEIVCQYPTLILADVYDVIAFYLRQKEEVEAYLLARRKESDALRKEYETKSTKGLRDRLLARRAEMNSVEG